LGQAPLTYRLQRIQPLPADNFGKSGWWEKLSLEVWCELLDEIKPRKSGVIVECINNCCPPKKGMSEVVLDRPKLEDGTLTVDNGKEFSNHESIAETLEIKVFFADPYSAWQRGLNENTNGLIRQYVPKGSDIRTLTDEQIEYIMVHLNNRPRKSLGFLTPNEVFYKRKKLTG
jgi:IS30 family transposase